MWKLSYIKISIGFQKIIYVIQKHDNKDRPIPEKIMEYGDINYGIIDAASAKKWFDKSISEKLYLNNKYN